MRRHCLPAFVAAVHWLVSSGCATSPESRTSSSTIEAVPDTPWGSAAIEIRYYDLRHTTRSELREEIRTALTERGMRSRGYTEWQIDSDYRYATSVGGCSLTQLDVSLDLTVTLPRLVNPERLRPALRADWQRFMRALREHHFEHKQIAVDCASRVAIALDGIREASDCESLEAAIAATMDEVIPSCHARGAQFDQQTGHGTSEGATF